MRHEKYNEKYDYAYIVYEVLRCSEENRNKEGIEGCVGEDCQVDPKCASKEEIDKWLYSKKIAFKVINNKINLQHDKMDEVL